MTDPVLPNPNPTPTPDPEPRDAGSRLIRCEACDCQLTPRGDAIKLSEKYRTWRDLDDKIVVLTREKNAAIAERDTALTEVRRLEAAARPPERKRGGILTSGI